MLLMLTSPDVLDGGRGKPDPEIARALVALHRKGHAVGIVSNRAQPAWHDSLFAGTGINHLHEPGRQDGKIVTHNAARFNLSAHDTIVLAGKLEDIQMAKNSGAVLIGAAWSDDGYVQKVGIAVHDAAELTEVVDLVGAWSGGWWFEGQQPGYSVRALCDLSGFNKPLSQQQFAAELTNLVKRGGPRLMALLAIAARSLLISGFGQLKSTMWGYFPSSHSANNDSDVLSDFTHRLRTTITRDRFAKRTEPLFLRHTGSTKRSQSQGGDRTDPTEQIETLQLNPAYRKNVRGRHVVVLDDCTTYGVSFGVASAFLRKAGASAVSGIALGKFGNPHRHYEIEIRSDPFAPVARGAYSFMSRPYSGVSNPAAQSALQQVFT